MDRRQYRDVQDYMDKRQYRGVQDNMDRRQHRDSRVKIREGHSRADTGIRGQKFSISTGTKWKFQLSSSKSSMQASHTLQLSPIYVFPHTVRVDRKKDLHNLMPPRCTNRAICTSTGERFCFLSFVCHESVFLPLASFVSYFCEESSALSVWSV